MPYQPPPPGHYYSRIYRPPLGQPSNLRTLGLWDVAISSGWALSMLLEGLKRVFQVVHPDSHHDQVYGYEIRQLLILACMEVESGWASILEANNYMAKRPKGSWSTADYVKLVDPLHLCEHKVLYHPLTSYGPCCPFEGWDVSRPTGSLPWYVAYNETKHHREVNLEKATLRNLMLAVGAAYVVASVQFGPNVYRQGCEFPLSMVEPITSPNLDEEQYDLDPSNPSLWTRCDYPF